LPLITFFSVGAVTYVTIAGFPALPTTLNPACAIKGNVSINSGRKIYHTPGDKFYAETIIRPEYGERWFCSEAEARAAGWRHARR
jgi:hypothetical protein